MLKLWTYNSLHIWLLFLKYVKQAGINSWLSWMSHAAGFWTASIPIKISNQIIYSPNRRIFLKKKGTFLDFWSFLDLSLATEQVTYLPHGCALRRVMSCDASHVASPCEATSWAILVHLTLVLYTCSNTCQTHQLFWTLTINRWNILPPCMCVGAYLLSVGAYLFVVLGNFVTVLAPTDCIVSVIYWHYCF